jgi:hypothetical protein
MTLVVLTSKDGHIKLALPEGGRWECVLIQHLDGSETPAVVNVETGEYIEVVESEDEMHQAQVDAGWRVRSVQAVG